MTVRPSSIIKIKSFLTPGWFKLLITALFCTALFVFQKEAQALDASSGVYKKSLNEIKRYESESGLKIWTWLGFISENGDKDPLHRAGKRSTFLAHSEVSGETHYIIVWFHGMNGFTDEFKTRTFPSLKNLVQRNISFTWIHPELPWSENVKGIDGRKVWTSKGSFLKFLVNARNTAPKVSQNKKIIYLVVGHSRGGKAISGAAVSGGLCDLNPLSVVWSDASYSDWLDKAWNSCLKEDRIQKEIWYLVGTETQVPVKRVLGLKETLGVKIHPLRSPWFHGKIGNNIIRMTETIK